ncbi:hypothetical protein QTP88_022812 [Uroleucon formosanum]
MIRPLLKQIIEKYLMQCHENEDTIVQTLKQTLASEIKRRFSLIWDSTESVLLEQIDSFLDPRFKDLDHEVLSNHEVICSKIKQIINQNNYLEPNEITTASQEQQNKHRSDLEYIFGINNEENDLTKEFQNYLAEPQVYDELLKVCKNINPEANRDFVVKEIQSFKGSFRKELKKVEDSKRSGRSADDVHIPTLWYYHLLEFTVDQELPTDGISNFNNTEAEDIDITGGGDITDELR